MGNRVIKESICYSDDIDQLTAFEETVFYRLIVNADDYGRIDARPVFLKSKLFVTKQGITEKNVSDAVSRLASIGLVRFYEVDRKPFLLFPKWSLHQRVRDSKEKYPAPPDDFDELADIRGDSPQVAADSGLNPIQSESNPNPNPNPTHAPARGKPAAEIGEPEGFKAFWDKYPRHVSKQAAVKAFTRIKSSELPAVMAGLDRAIQSADWQRNIRDGTLNFIPHASTWINGRRWEDDVGGGGQQSGKQQSSKYSRDV